MLHTDKLLLTCIPKTIFTNVDFSELTSPITPTVVYLGRPSRSWWMYNAQISQRARRDQYVLGTKARAVALNGYPNDKEYHSQLIFAYTRLFN